MRSQAPVPMILLLLATAGLAAVEPTIPDPADRALVEAARAAAAQLPAGGIVVALSTRGVRQFWRFGHPHPDATLAPERIRFEIGSVTKLFNAVLLARLSRNGGASFDQRLKDVLPPLALADQRMAEIPLGSLADHTSGLPRLPPNLATPDSDDPYATYDGAALLAAVAAQRLPPPSSRAERAYSNYGTGLLGYLLAEKHKQTWPRLLELTVTIPAKLHDTRAAPDAELDLRLAQPHVGATAVKPWRWDALAAAGAMRSSAADLLTFGEGLLGADDDLRLDLAELTARMSEGAGPGIFQDVDADRPVFWHDGATGGSCSLIRLDVGARRVEVVLANQAEVFPMSLIQAAHPPPILPEAPPLPGWERDLPGVYRLADGAELTFLAVAGTLRARLTGQPFSSLVSTGADTWRWRGVPARLAVHRESGANGAVVAVSLLQNGQCLRALRTDRKPPDLRFPPAAELAPLAGTYEGPIGRLQVDLRGDTLFARLNDQLAFPVFATPGGRFAYDVVVAELAVEREVGGAPVALVLHQNGQEHRFARRP